MLEKPDLQKETIITFLQDKYELQVDQVVFLPLGADINTAVYHITTTNNSHYFLKLRSGVFDETSVTLPKFLSEQGIQQIIAPLATNTGQFWGRLGDFKTILYPFVYGRNGYEITLSDLHWHEFGESLKNIHTITIPQSLTKHIRREDYLPVGREIVKTSLAQIEDHIYDDPVAVKTAALLKRERDQILDLIKRAERLAQVLQDNAPPFIVCHSDLHAGNIFIGVDDAFYIVDWDEPILAPKERDLMCIGGGLMGNGRTPQEEETLFYRAYGQTEINHNALAYYRYERIIQDISEYCQQLLLSDEGGQDREQSYQYLASNFLPEHTIDIAYRSDET